RPNFLRANSSRYASREAHASEKAVEHKGIRRTHIGLTVGDIALVVRKRRTAGVHEQVAGWWKALDHVRLGPDRRHRVLHLPAIRVLPPRHTPAISLPALSAKPGTTLTHLGKLHHTRAHVTWGRCGK